MRRRQLTLPFLFILGVTIWATQRWWLPWTLGALGWLGDKPGDRIQALDSAVSLLVLIFNAIIAYRLWLARTPAPKVDEPLLPLKATTWQAIRNRRPQGAAIAWVDRGATDPNQLPAQPRIALVGKGGEGKTREAAELMGRAVATALLPSDQVFEPNQDFLNTTPAVIATALHQQLAPNTPAFLHIDDLHTCSDATLERLSELV